MSPFRTFAVKKVFVCHHAEITMEVNCNRVKCDVIQLPFTAGTACDPTITNYESIAFEMNYPNGFLLEPIRITND